jgi:hypothetical protein
MRLGVTGRPRHRASATAFLEALAARAELISHAAAGQVDGWLALDPVDGLATGIEARRTVVWWSDPASVRPRGGAALVVVRVAPGQPSPAAAVGFPWPGTDVRHCLHLTPPMRERWRRTARLPAELPVDLWERVEAPDEYLRALLLLASAVAARGATAVEALARGAPLVTDDATATKLGLHDGNGAVVVTGSERRDALHLLAADPARAVLMSLMARRHAEARLDQAGPADAAVGLLAGPCPDPMVRVLGQALAELWTPPTSGVVADAARRVAALVPAPVSAPARG